MRQQIAKATKEKLEEDERVKEASIKENDKGVYVEARTPNRMLAEELRSDLHQYSVWVDVVVG